jgi:hypothetical protein
MDHVNEMRLEQRAQAKCKEDDGLKLRLRVEGVRGGKDKDQ